MTAKNHGQINVPAINFPKKQMLVRSTPGPGRQINLSMALLAMGGVGVMVEVEDNGLAAISNELSVEGGFGWVCTYFEVK